MFSQKGMHAFIPEKCGTRGVGTYKTTFKEILCKKETILTFLPTHPATTTAIQRMDYLISKFLLDTCLVHELYLLYLMSRWLKMVLHSCPLDEMKAYQPFKTHKQQFTFKCSLNWLHKHIWLCFCNSGHIQ